MQTCEFKASRSPSTSWPSRILEHIALSRWRTILVGGLTFWAPDLVYHLLIAMEPSIFAIVSMTILMPLTVGVTCTQLRRHVQTRKHSVALSMLLGIYLLGPTMMMLNSTPFGGGFSKGDFLGNLMMCVAFGVLPPYTFIMATYDLSLFALISATFSLIILHLLYEYGRGVSRPGATPSGTTGARIAGR